MKRFRMVALISMLVIALVAVSGCAVSDSVTLSAASAAPAKGSAEAEPSRALASAINDFGFDALRALEGDGTSKSAAVFSPLSAHAALAMTSNGADGNTLTEMNDVLRLADFEGSDANNAYADLLVRLQSELPTSTLSVANSIWIDDAFPVRQAFVDTDADYFGAEAGTLDLQDAGAAKRLNRWASDHTNGRIKEVIEQSALDANSALVLMNAVYLHAKWAEPFEKDSTHEREFATPGGTTQVEMMHATREMRYAEADDVQIAALPYRDPELAMYVVLPAARSTLADVEASLTADSFTDLQERMRPTQVIFGMPKLHAEKKAGLKATLKAMGMASAFDREKANFSRMSPMSPVWIDDVTQSTFLDVDEEGTEAAAVTVVEMLYGSAGPAAETPEMICDRPYLILLVHEPSGAVLFEAAVRDPSGAAK